LNSTDIPRISVVIPAYNAAEFLGEAIQSVLAQTCQPIEIIVVDDGSKDETPAVAVEYSGKITYIRKPNGGDASARNVGVRAATGDWVAFLDADDKWAPTLLETLFECACKTGTDFVFCDSVSLNNGIIGGPTFLEKRRVKDRLNILAPQGVLLNPFELFTEVGCYILTSGVMIRREVILNAGLFDEAIFCSNDFDLWLRLSLGNRFGVVKDPLMFRRIHASNISQNPWTLVDALLKVNGKIEQYAIAYPSTIDWREFVRQEKARLLREKGSLFLERGDSLPARESYSLSLQAVFSIRVAIYWLATFLPASWTGALRNWKFQFMATVLNSGNK